MNHASDDAGLDEKGHCAVEMAVDEACSNIIEHGYKGMPEGDIECTCDQNDRALTIIIRDHGQAFNIDNVPIPDITDDLEDRRVGGLGVFLIRELMDKVQYERLGETGNVLTLVRKIKSRK